MITFNFFTILTIIIVSLQIFKFWVQSKGNLWLSYRLDVVVFTCYLIIETALAFNDSSQISILLFNIVNLWALFCSIRGIFRLRKENRNKLN